MPIGILGVGVRGDGGWARINKLYSGLRVRHAMRCVIFFTRFDLLPMNRLLNVWHFIRKKYTD